MKRKIVHFIASELRDALDNQIGGLMSAEKDMTYGLSDSLYEAIAILDEVVTKYKQALGVEDSNILAEMADVLNDIADDYDTSDDETEVEVDVEPIQPSQDLGLSNDKVIDVEVIK